MRVEVLMGKHGSKLDSYKNEYIGKTSWWLTCIDVIYENNKYLVVCKCKCGNTKTIPIRSFKTHTTKSCGCYKKSEEFSNKQRQYILDRPDIIANSIEKTRQWCNEHPDKVRLRNQKVSEWAKENHDRIEAKEVKHRQWFVDHKDEFNKQCERQRQFYRDNPCKAKEISDRQIQFYKDNPDKCLEISHRMLQWWADECNAERASNEMKNAYRNNPDIASNRGAVFSQWAKDNHDKILERASKRLQWCKNNPDKVKEASDKISDTCKRKRLVDYKDLLEIIHPDYVESLLSGNIKADSIIKTKCPICGEYAEHSFNNTYLLNDGKLKAGRGRLCDKCVLQSFSSSNEQEIADYISTFYSGECVRNSRNIISPFELDLYYPEKKIAIEFNGDYWHSSEFKPDDYHYNKFRMCLNNNLTLVSIFESMWLNHKEDAKAYLKDIFNDRENSLSFSGNYLINNNFPPRDIIGMVSNGEYVEEHYSFGKYTVYTCGFTKLKSS
jgi:hypothetical protein